MKKKSTAKKVLLTILGVLLALVIVLVGTVYVIWHDEITTLLSFQQVTQRDESHKDGSVYVLNVSGGYHFDEFLAQGGASNDTELISFITNSITKGIIPMNIKTSEIACSAFTADTGFDLFMDWYGVSGRKIRRTATAFSAATTISTRRTPSSSTRIRATAVMLPIPRWTCSSSA